SARTTGCGPARRRRLGRGRRRREGGRLAGGLPADAGGRIATAGQPAGRTGSAGPRAGVAVGSRRCDRGGRVVIQVADGLGRLGSMELRDRLGNLAAFAGAAVTWALVGVVVTTRDPRIEPDAGLLGAGLIGAALGLTAVPL